MPSKYVLSFIPLEKKERKKKQDMSSQYENRKPPNNDRVDFTAFNVLLMDIQILP